MKRYTKFGVWDKEVKELIGCIVGFLPEGQAAAVTEWFYTEGLMIFQKSQGVAHMVFVEEQKKKTGLMPMISALHMLGQKFQGFYALQEAFSAKFFASDSDRAVNESGIYAMFLVMAVGSHKRFYEVQANVTNVFYNELNTNPKFDKSQMMSFLLQQFEKAKEQYSDIANEIDDHILLLTEYESVMKEAREAKSATALTLNSTFAKRVEEYQEIKKEEPRPAVHSSEFR